MRVPLLLGQKVCQLGVCFDETCELLEEVRPCNGETKLEQGPGLDLLENQTVATNPSRKIIIEDKVWD